MILTVTRRFEAAHVLPKHPGKCSRLHGHSWVLHVSVEGPVDPETGFVMDFARLKDVVDRHVTDVLDHRFLGSSPLVVGGKHYVAELPINFYPTSENLVDWVVTRLQPLLPRLSEVSIEETCTSEATWKKGRP